MYWFVSAKYKGEKKGEKKHLKMGDSIKFGPEWLRNMSNDTGGLSSAATSSTGGGGTNNFAYPNNRKCFSNSF